MFTILHTVSHIKFSLISFHICVWGWYDCPPEASLTIYRTSFKHLLSSTFRFPLPLIAFLWFHYPTFQCLPCIWKIKNGGLHTHYPCSSSCCYLSSVLVLYLSQIARLRIWYFFSLPYSAYLCIFRGLGPWGPNIVRGYTKARFVSRAAGTTLNEHESKLLTGWYIY